MTSLRLRRRGNSREPDDGDETLAATPPAPPEPPSGDDASDDETESRGIVRSIGTLLSGQAIAQLLGVASLLVVPRALGAQDSGWLATAGAIGYFVSTLSVFGTSDHLIKMAARSRAEAAHYVVNVIVLRSAIWVAVLAALIPATFLIVEDTTARILIIISGVGVIFPSIGEAALGGLQAHHALGRAVIVRSSIMALGRGFSIAIVLAGASVVYFLSTFTAVAALTAALTLFIFWRQFGGPVRLGVRVTSDMARAGAPFFAWDLSRILYGSSDILMLAWLTNAATVGRYNIVQSLMAVPVFIPVVIRQAMLPSLARWATPNPTRFRSSLTGALRVVLIASVPAGVGLIALADELPAAIGGEEFRAATPVLVITAPMVPLVAIDTLLGTAVKAIDRQRELAIVGWAATVLNISLNLLAIPLTDSWWGNGGIGAATTTLVTEMFVGIWAVHMLRGRVDWLQLAGVAARVAVACAVMAGAVLLVVGPVGVFLAVPIGAAVYGVAALALRLVAMSDVRAVRTAFRSGTPAAEAQPDAGMGATP